MNADGCEAIRVLFPRSSAAAVPGSRGDRAAGIFAAMLAAEEVSKRYGDVVALIVSRSRWTSGGCLALVGESGAGKSTLLRCFNRLVDPDAGRIRDRRRRRARARPDRAAAPDRLRPAGGRTPAALAGGTKRGAGTVAARRSGGRTTVPRRRSRSWGSSPRASAAGAPSELSGGQRQRVALARALAARPPVVLLDEPFGALDAITRGELREAFAELRASVAFTCVLVTHDLHEAVALSTRIAVLRNGRVEQDARSVRAPLASGHRLRREAARRGRG